MGKHSGLEDWPPTEEAAVEKTLCLFKRDAFLEGTVMRAAQMISRRLPDLEIVNEAYFPNPDEELVRQHYSNLIGAPHCDLVVNEMTKGPVYAVIYSGEDATARLKALAGATDPSMAATDTIRYLLSKDSTAAANAAGRASRTVIHRSGSTQDAEIEVLLWEPAMEAAKAVFREIMGA